MACSRSARPSPARSPRSACRPSRPREPTSIAACSAAPPEIPASTPSRAALRRAVSIASSSSTATISSITSRLSTSGTKPAPMPWILCGPGSPPESTGDAFGSTATTCRSGLRSLSRSPQPVIVPPVPTPATSTSTRPVGVAPDLLGGGAPVDLRVGRVGELVGDPAVAALAADAARLLDRLVHAAHRLHQHDLGAVQAQQVLALAAHALRHRQDQVVALGGADERERDAGVARGGLDDRVAARLDAALGLGDVDHRHADAVLDAAGRVVGLELARAARRRNRAPAASAVTSRRVADEVGEVLWNRAGDRRHGHGPTVAAGQMTSPAAQPAGGGASVRWYALPGPDSSVPSVGPSRPQPVRRGIVVAPSNASGKASGPS